MAIQETGKEFQHREFLRMQSLSTQPCALLEISNLLSADASYIVRLFGTEIYREAFDHKNSGVGDGFSRLYTDDLFGFYAVFPHLPISVP